MDQVTVKQVDLWNGEHRTEAFKALNSSVTIPLIVLDDGTAISETTAITEYIDHTYPGINLTGRMPKERAIIHMMQRRGEQKIVDAIGAYFHHATPGFGPEIELNQNKAWGEAHLAKTLEGMRYFNDILEQQPFIAPVTAFPWPTSRSSPASISPRLIRRSWSRWSVPRFSPGVPASARVDPVRA